MTIRIHSHDELRVEFSSIFDEANADFIHAKLNTRKKPEYFVENSRKRLENQFSGLYIFLLNYKYKTKQIENNSNRYYYHEVK